MEGPARGSPHKQQCSIWLKQFIELYIPPGAEAAPWLKAADAAASGRRASLRLLISLSFTDITPPHNDRINRMLTLNLQSRIVRLALLVLALFAWGSFGGLAVLRFVKAVVTDPQVPVERATLEAAAAYFPDSARVQARLAAHLIEADIDASDTHERTAERAVYHAARAASLAPWNYDTHVLLASAKELQGDLAGAETALRRALGLAPRRVELRWRLANLLLRAEKLELALSELQLVTAADPARLTAALDLAWQATAGSLADLQKVAGAEQGRQLTLAHFLAQRGETDAAVKLALGLDAGVLIGSPLSGQILDALLAARQMELAGEFWRHLLGEYEQSLVWNGDFERPARSGLAHFDWQLGQNDKVRVGLSSGAAHSGQRALRLSYLGVETTRLEGEIKQLVLVRPGARYRLSCFVKTEGLVTPDGPQLAVSRTDAPTPLAISTPVAPGSNDWQALTVEFTAPQDARALVIGIRQTPRFSYADPSRGTVWFDDFTLIEQGNTEHP